MILYPVQWKDSDAKSHRTYRSSSQVIRTKSEEFIVHKEATCGGLLAHLIHRHPESELLRTDEAKKHRIAEAINIWGTKWRTSC